MGHRIELGEIEAAAAAQTYVGRACCLYDEEEKKIILFYAGDEMPERLSADLRAFLPRYMLPSVVRRVDAMPLTPNGKLDRRALSALYHAETAKKP